MHQRPKRRPRRQCSKLLTNRHWRRLLAGTACIGLGMSLGLSLRLQAKAAAAKKDRCQTIHASQAVLSRQQLTQLLTVPERENRQAIEEIAAEPYCTLAAIEVRAGVMAERAVYPLAFDPNTWLVVLYEEEEYVGYGFKIQH
ncbi:MAG: hypothetical protein F6K31_04385 [Symploca sp. SIO2G7]|nr:hypothetical protein [Symploca sp. SIO2G7]